jgi:hypothetical protein
LKPARRTSAIEGPASHHDLDVSPARRHGAGCARSCSGLVRGVEKSSQDTARSDRSNHAHDLRAGIGADVAVKEVLAGSTGLRRCVDDRHVQLLEIARSREP